jgi:putative ABC transport system permease protein
MRPEPRISPVLLSWVMLGEWRARPGRLLLAVLAIAVGVALGLAVHLVNRSALEEFARAIRTVNGEADLQVRATSQAGFGEDLYPRLAKLPGVAGASPVEEFTAASDTAPHTTLTLLGTDVLRTAAVTPSLLGRRSGPLPADLDEAPFAPKSLFLSSAALQALGRPIGSRLRLSASGHSAEFVIAGTLPQISGGVRVGVIDIAEAQWRFGQLGRLQRVDLRLAPGAERGRAVAAIRAVLPADAQLVTPQSAAEQSDNLSRAYRVNLEMLAMVALLTGGFLVYSAQSLSVARRRPQFAVLRVLGRSRRGMLGQILTEGLVLGVLGGLLGVAAGVGLAQAALRLFGGDLGGGYFDRGEAPLVFTPIAALVIFGLGVVVAVAGSLGAALEAQHIPPAVALKATAGEALDPRRATRPWLGVLLLAAGSAAALGPPIGGLPLLGYAAIALMLAGGVAAMPWLARVLLHPLRRLRDPSPPVALAASRLWGAPGQAAIALCGIVASTSLTIAMAVMVTSFRGSVDEWLTQVLPSDLYLQILDPGAGGLSPDLQQRLAHAPGVSSIEFRQAVPLQLAPERPPIELIARSVGPVQPEQALPLIGRAHAVPPGATPAWASEPLARIYKLRAGDRMALPLSQGVRSEVFIAGIWRDYARSFGALVLNQPDYTRLTGDVLRSEAVIEVRPGTPVPAAASALRRVLPPELMARASLAEPRQLRALALRIFDRSFAVTYALEAIAVAVGLTGVAATFSAQTLARRKEFGVLRHIGVLRRQIMLMLAVEGALLGVVGAVAGCMLGTGMSQVLIQVINPQSFHWTMETRLPWALFAGLTVALVATSAATAVLAGRGAIADAAVRAVAEDW